MFTFINRFTVTGDTAEFESVLGEITQYMTAQEGFRTSNLYRSARDPQTYVEMAEWTDAQAHRAALSGDGFQVPVQKLMKLATAEPAPFDLLARHDGS